MAYIKGDEERVEGCLFCVLPGRGAECDRDSLIVHRGELAYVMLNAYPYNPGHLMAVPYRHEPELEGLTRAELYEVADLCQRAVRALRASSGPDGFNVGFNLGGFAGAGIAEHLHQHVVPRWDGDTNFMTVTGSTRVLPELLEETYERLRPAFASA
jgi:ATP adenylyltransferase